MSVFNTSSELFTDSDNTSDGNFESASSISSISAVSSLSSISSISSISSTSSISQRSSSSYSEAAFSDQSFESMPVQTRRSRMMADSDSQSSYSSAASGRSTVTQHLDSDHEMSTDNTSSNRTDNLTNNTFGTNDSSDTETYDVDAEMMRVNDGGVIEINDTQMPNDVINDNDDDVILIPQNIETIDLCTQAAPVPIRLHNEIIDITDSPGNENSRFGPIRRMTRRRISQVEIVDNTPNRELEPQPTTSTPNARQQLNLDDSFNETQPKFALSCPICMESMVNREPISTVCGHLFCKKCIVLAMSNVKKCPMCKKTLGGKKPFFNIFLPC